MQRAAGGVATLGVQLHKKGAFWERLNPETNAELLERLANALVAAYDTQAALLTHCRALRAALVQAKGYAAEIERSLYDHEGDAKGCAQHIQREAAAVLCGAQDQEGA